MSDQEDTKQPKPSIFDAAEPPDDEAMHHEEEAPIQPDGDGKPKKKFLDTSVPVGDIDPYDHGAEEKVRRDHEEGLGIAPPELPEGLPIDVNNPAMMVDSTDSVKDEVEKRFRSEFGNRKVEVTPKERADFVRAALSDTELVFQIPVEGTEAVIDVAIPPDVITTSAMFALDKWIKDGFISEGSDLQWLLSFQQIHAWYQIRAVNGIPTEWSALWADGMPSIANVRNLMCKPETFDVFHKMNAVRWRMLLDAARVAELKYKLCLENWQNRSFFTGAGTA